MIRAAAPGRTTHLRRGYTLIEMLIAVSLVAVLMIAVWGLISMYATLQTTGAEITAEQQLVRSIQRLMQSDVTAVALPVAEAAPESLDPFAAFEPALPDSGFGNGIGGGSSSSGSFRVSFDINDFQRNPDGGPANISFQGTGQTIKLTIPRPAAPLPPVSDIDQLNQLGGGSASASDRLPDGTAPVVAEFQTIIYQFQPFGSTENGALPFGLYRIQADAAQLQMMLTRRRRPDDDFFSDDLRLSRELIEELLFPPPAEGSNISVQPTVPPVCDLIPEVADCRFEFRSGGKWHNSWVSQRNGTLPDAVRITLDVMSAVELDDLQAMYVSQEPAGQLEQVLLRNSTRPERPPRRSRQNDRLEQLRIVPRRYQTLILLDTTVDTGPTSSSEPGGLDL